MYNVKIDISYLLTILENEMGHTPILERDRALYLQYIEGEIRDGLYDGAVFEPYEIVWDMYEAFTVVCNETADRFDLIPQTYSAGPYQLVRRDDYREAAGL